jgi:DnaJ-domain-containing protein 1
VSLTKRLVDLAKSNLNSLLEKAADTADPRRKLNSLTDDELEQELERRRSMRAGEAAVRDARARIDADEPKPASAPPPASASSASSSSASSSSAPPNGAPPRSTATSDREARAQAAREREARVKAARESREAEVARRAAKAAEKARAQAEQQARSAPPPRSSAPPPGAGARSGAAPRAPRGADPMVVQYYARLELSYGAPWEDVKASYRRLMRKYHPDLHAGSPAKLKAATEVSQALTQAYNELDKILNK